MPQTLTGPIRLEADGFGLTECPRWRDGQLYFSDISGKRVHRLSADGKVETLLERADGLAGLGFLPDGDLLVVSMREEKVLRLSKAGAVRDHADLSAVVRHGINDMVVDSVGRAYVTQFGFQQGSGQPPAPCAITIVEPDGRVHAASNDLLVPNGIVIAPDGRTLIVAESGGGRLAAYDIGKDGALSNHRIFAQLPPEHTPDGICVDSEGGVWVACVFGPGFVRVREGGAITHFVPLQEGRYGYACMLGGADRRTLYLCTGERFDAANTEPRRTSRIESIRVDIPGAGLP